jgi:outer membrane biosynthesis protein TonB
VKLDQLFDWPSRHNVHLALPVMVVLSIALHVAGVAVFQIVRPRTENQPLRTAQVTFLAPGSAEAARLAARLAADDPALFSPTQTTGRDPWKLPETVYTPSFDAKTPALLAAPAPAAEMILPPAARTGPMAPAEKPAVTRPAAPAPATTVTLGGGLAGRTLTPPEGFAFTVPGPDTPRATAPVELLLAVAPDGRPMYFFPPERSSGSEWLDRAALRFLAGSRFSATEADGPAWGTATFHWGADVTARPAP